MNNEVEKNKTENEINEDEKLLKHRLSNKVLDFIEQQIAEIKGIKNV